MMINTEDEQWLRSTYPGLIPSAKGVEGRIQFKATYNSQSGHFLILSDDVIDEVGGLALSGSFTIRMEPQNHKSPFALPALYVEGLETDLDRHFIQTDKSACLCSPFEEDDFLQPEFKFKQYLEQLVIPFLYGQLFYSTHQHWPWPDYAHGATGLLESYSKIGYPNKTQEVLKILMQFSIWPQIKKALQHKPHIKGHTPCFCTKMDQIRRCHPKALQGALRLQQDILTLGIDLNGDKNVSLNQR